MITPIGIAELQLAMLALVWGVDCRCPVQLPAKTGNLSKQKGPLWLGACVVVVFGSYLIFGLDLLSSFPFGWDSLAYHLPVAVKWLQEGSLQLPASRAWRLSLSGNGEILTMLLLSTGRQSLAPAGNWAALIVLAGATYLIAKRIGNSQRVPSFAAALLVVSIPIVEFQTFMNYVDLFGTAFLAAAVAMFLCRYKNHSSPGADMPAKNLSFSVLTMSTLACGISVGTKPIYYLYAGIYVLVLVIIMVRERSLHKKSAGVLAAVIALGLLAPSTFWFARGFQATGNPIYPLRVAFGQRVIFPGYSPSQITSPEFADRFVHKRSEWLIYPWTEWLRSTDDWQAAYSEDSGAGAAFATFVPLGVAFAAYQGFVRRRSSASQRFFLIIWLTLLIGWWFLQNRVPRFGLPLWVLACVLCIPLFTCVYKSESRILGALLLVSLVSTFAISTFVPVHALLHRIRTRNWTRAAFYGYPPIIDDLPKGSRILNDTGFMTNNFPLAGEKLNNYVIAAADLPKQLTPEFIASEKVEYIVQIPSESGDGVSVVAPIPPSIAVTDFATSNVNGKLWRIWKVTKP